VPKSLRDAEVSSLANVRERHLHSAKAWQTMAERAARVEQARQQQQDMPPSPLFKNAG
jgi:hypothetical protein